MRLNPIKKRILEAMAEESQPRKPKDIAQKVKLNFSSCMMHILGLKKAGLVSSPEKGYYQITDSGKGALEPGISKEAASSLLSPLPPEKAFHFYTGIHESSGVEANSLLDFCETLKDIDVKSLEFHVARQDFQRWLQSIGARELARKLENIREKGMSGEGLRKELYAAARTRCDELLSITKSA
jgi:predicted transcriptional regulator